MKRKLIWLVTLALLLSAVISLPMTVHATICDTHTYGEWQTRTEATCDYPGFQVRYCKDCGWEDSRNYPPALGHNFQFVVRDQPSCTTPGYGIDTCTRCGANRDNGRRIDALGHSYQRKVAQEATCTKDGTAVYTCSRCGDSYREPIPATGHSWQNEHKDATCTAAGYDRQKCSKCGVIQNEKSIPATGHKWGVWVDGDPATCVQYGNRYHECTRCGQKEWERNYAGGLGDHDWGEWVTVKEPTATEPGLQERTCKVEASHKEQQEIPATGVDEKPALSIILWSEDSKTDVPKSEFSVGESYFFNGKVTNTGNIDIELYDIEYYESFWDHSLTDEMPSRYLLKPGESVDSWGGDWLMSISGDANLKDVIPGTETEAFAGTITYTVTVPGYRPGTDEVICSDTASCTIGILKPADEKPAAYDISASYSEGPIVVEPSSSYERYWTAVNVLSENGGIDWRYHYGYADSSDVTVDRIVWREFRDGGSSYSFCFDPTIKKPQDHIIPGTETEEYAGEATLLVWAVGYLPDTNTEVCRSDALQIPLLVKKEEPKPAIKLIVIQYEPEVEKEAYKEGESFGYEVEVTNTGNVPLQFDPYIKIDTSRIINLSAYKDRILDPGKTWYQAGEPFSVHPTVSNKYMIPDPEDSPYAGRQPITFWVEGFAADDKDHTTPICDDGPITFEYKVAKPGGPEPWSIPEESQLEVYPHFAPSSARPSDPAGYQLGEHWNTWINMRNVGSVPIETYALRVDYIADNKNSSLWYSSYSAAIRNTDFTSWHEIDYKLTINPD
ncbi:MAG: hypothetical protein IK133_07315, partial [Clostridia bacterium]|nr:hypothetical protein [Clostridia bacterium]